jgi:HAD superfamily hydrolase (TIGR01450 family)
MVGGELLGGYDILLIDLYGVVWGGSHAYPAALEALRSAMASGRPVGIVSNSSLSASVMLARRDSQYLVRGVHFTDFITSGDVLRRLLTDGDIAFKNVKNPKKYFPWGASGDDIFADSGMEKTATIAQADFIYGGIPSFSAAERARLPREMDEYLYAVATHGGGQWWDSTSLEPYLPRLREFLAMGKPFVVANPDRTAICGVLATPDGTETVLRRVVRQGSLAEAYAAMGGEVLILGKPFPAIYRHAIGRLAAATNESAEALLGRRMAMVGDTLETDILGAANASRELGCTIDGILVLSGLSSHDMAEMGPTEDMDAAMEALFIARGIRPTHAMAALDNGATVYF